MAVPRTFWKGHLRLALVTIPIRLTSATSGEAAVRMHQVDRKSKQRIRYQKVTAEDGDVVERDDIVRGVEVEPGQYVLIEDGELDALKLETRHRVELTEFVDVCEIDPLYFDRPYYVIPNGEVAEEGYIVIRDALRDAKRSGIGQLTMRGRENLVCLTPAGDGLLLTSLRYETEVKDAADIFAGLSREKPRADLVKMARQLIDERASDFDANDYRNHYADALKDLVEAKLKGEGLTDVSGGDDRAASAQVIDFSEALKRSVGGKAKSTSGRGSKKPSKSAAASTRRPPSKRSGGKSSKRKSGS